MRRIPLLLLTALLATFALVFAPGCGSDSDGDGSPTGGGSPIAINGTVHKGPVDGAEVTVREITAAGALGAALAGPFTTDVTGRFTGDVPAGSSGYYVLVADGGTYVDESTGSTVTMTQELYGVIQIGTTNVGAVTPFTHAAVLNAFGRMAQGQPTQSAFADAVGDLTTALGFNPMTTAPEGAGRGLAEQIYTALLAGISQLIDDNVLLSPTFDDAETFDLIWAIAVDLSDGTLDGTDIFGVTIVVDPDGAGPGEPITIPGLDANGIDALVEAAREWAAINFPGLTIPDIDTDDFGDPTWTIGDFGATGSLTVTGTDAGAFGNPFTPTSAVVTTDAFSVGVTFFMNEGQYEIERTVSIGSDTEVGNGVTVAVALSQDGYWPNYGFPIQGVTLNVISEDHYQVVFQGLVLTDPGDQGTVILNGTLNAVR